MHLRPTETANGHGQRVLWRAVQVEGRGEAEVARLATLQRGLVARDQLVEAGIGRGAIAHWLAVGRLVALHRTIYRLGHEAPVPFSRELAAALYSGGRGVLSGHSAAAIWKAWEPDEHRDVRLMVVGQGLRSRPGLRVTRTTSVHPSDWRLEDGLPVTTPARTLIELAADEDPRLERALAEFRVQRLLVGSELQEAIDRAGRRPGIARLREIIAAEGDSGYTRSEAERRPRALLREAQLPMPRFNHRLLGYEVDALWPEERIVV